MVNISYTLQASSDLDPEALAERFRHNGFEVIAEEKGVIKIRTKSIPNYISTGNQINMFDQFSIERIGDISRLSLHFNWVMLLLPVGMIGLIMLDELLIKKYSTEGSQDIITAVILFYIAFAILVCKSGYEIRKEVIRVLNL